MEPTAIDNNKKIKIGVVGAGFAAHVRSYALKKRFSDRMEILAINDTNKTNLTEYADEFQVEPYEKLEDLLDNKEIDTIFVCVPSIYHFSIIKKCLDYKKNVLCEYPLTTDYREAVELVEVAKTGALILHTGQTMHFDEDKIIILKYLNKLGRLYLGYKYMSFGEAGSWFTGLGYGKKYENIGKWFVNTKETGGFIITGHYHGIQTFRKVFGEVEYVTAVDSSRDQVGAASILMKHVDGSSSTIQWGMTIMGRNNNKTIVTGENGTIELNGESYYVKTKESKFEGKMRDAVESFKEVFELDLGEFLKEMNQDKDNYEANLDMLKTLQASIAAQRSADTGGEKIRVDEIT